jgi:hypothetical protein
MKSLVNLALVVGGLCAETEHLRTKLANLCVVVAEGTSLRSATASAGIASLSQPGAAPGRPVSG